MLIEVESFINSLFVKLLEGKVKFHFVSAILNFLENPKTDSFLLIARFSQESYALVLDDIERLKPALITYKDENVGYSNVIRTLISETLSDYSYTFQDKNDNSVQSSLIFLLLNTLSKGCTSDLIDFICTKELSDVFSRPQIYSSSYIFSTIMHKLLERGYDEIALKAAIHFENKSLIFAKDVSGQVTMDIALQNNCKLSVDYIEKLKAIGETAGLIIN